MGPWEVFDCVIDVHELNDDAIAYVKCAMLVALDCTHRFGTKCMLLLF